MSQEYEVALGQRLRAVRRQRGLTLHQVEEQSQGRWTVEVVGSYERGQRAVTVTVLAELAEFYGLTTAELLPTFPVTTPPIAGGRFTVGPGPSGRPICPPGRAVRWPAMPPRHRGDHGGTVLTIRERDLQSLAVVYGMEPDALTAMLLHSGVLTVETTRNAG